MRNFLWNCKLTKDLMVFQFINCLLFLLWFMKIGNHIISFSNFHKSQQKLQKQLAVFKLRHLCQFWVYKKSWNHYSTICKCCHLTSFSDWNGLCKAGWLGRRLDKNWQTCHVIAIRLIETRSAAFWKWVE